MGDLIKLPTTLEFELVACPSCGHDFALAKVLEKSRRRDGKTFWCPNGHSLWFPPPKEEASNASAGGPQK